MEMTEFDAAVAEAAVLAERQTDLYALFGHPVAHSKSPYIHARFAESAKQRLRYIAVDAPPEDFAQLLEHFAEEGGRGANVTLPLKGLAHDLCAELSESARIAAAANTLTRLSDGRWRGDNTDGIGLVRDIAERHRIDLRGRRALLLGAGGAARGVAGELLSAGIKELTIVNRSPERADALADRIGRPDRVHTLYWADLADAGSFDLILNATSAGRLGEALSLPFSLAGARSLCYDLSYGDAARGFLAWARATKAAYALDGLGMLVEQAAESFQIWRGMRPDTETVFQALRARQSGV